MLCTMKFWQATINLEFAKKYNLVFFGKGPSSTCLVLLCVGTHIKLLF